MTSSFFIVSDIAAWYTNQVEEGMPTQPVTKTNSQPLAGHDFLYYWRRFRLPLVVAGVIAIVLYVFRQPMVYIIFVELVYLLFVAWFMIKRQQATQGQAIVADVLAGLVLGLIMSVFKLLFFWKLYLFFNIVTETLVTGLGGLLAGAALYTILHRQTTIAQSILPDREHPPASEPSTQPKGGEIDDPNS